MDLKEFMMAMAFAVQRQVPGDVEVFPQTVCKNNGVIWQGLTFRKQGCNTAPTIYLEPYFESYQEGVSVECLAVQVADCYGNYACHPQFEPDFFQNYETIRERIVYKLINYHRNAQLLTEVPHLPYLDLAMVFYCMLSHSQIGMASIMIRESHLKMWGISHKTLFQDAKQNTPLLLKPEFKSMNQVLGMSVDEMGDTSLLHVLTNEEHTNGAASILYDGILERCADQLRESFFLLPSSIHEVLLLPYNRTVEIRELRSIVREANATHVEPQDRLSDSVYFYSREEKKLLIL